MAEIADLIDLERYPIDDLGSVRGKALVDAARRGHEADGAANLPGFIRAEAVPLLAAEANALLEKGYRKTKIRTAYYRPPDPDLAADHPRCRLWQEGSLQLADDQIGPETLLRKIYKWDPLTAFVAAVEGYPKLYRMADEFQALNIIAHGEGEALPWHYDVNDFTVTLLLQDAEAGGAFVYASDIRKGDDENYADVERVFAGDNALLRTLPRAAGTLTLFRGRNSLHSVTPVEGARERITAILTYDARPDCVASERGNTYLYGPRVENIYRARREGAT
jgi:hypothetical protein